MRTDDVEIVKLDRKMIAAVSILHSQASVVMAVPRQVHGMLNVASWLDNVGSSEQVIRLVLSTSSSGSEGLA